VLVPVTIAVRSALIGFVGGQSSNSSFQRRRRWNDELEL
jgi:hypothetical protein